MLMRGVFRDAADAVRKRDASFTTRVSYIQSEHSAEAMPLLKAREGVQDMG